MAAIAPNLRATARTVRSIEQREDDMRIGRNFIAVALALTGIHGCAMSGGEDEQEPDVEVGLEDEALHTAPVDGSEGPSIQVNAQIDCEAQNGDTFFAVRCYFLGPSITQYRAVATCTRGNVAYGSWQTLNSGNWSRANCGTNNFVIDRWIQTRN